MKNQQGKIKKKHTLMLTVIKIKMYKVSLKAYNFALKETQTS